nr:15082_t:CDS:2 [Entrophospora candida]
MDYPTRHQTLTTQSNCNVVPTPQRDYENSSRVVPQRRNRANSQMTLIETMVTQLLVTTKALLESLNGWAAKYVKEKQVSDIYVKLVSEFNSVVQLFSQTGVDISDLVNIPTDLRACLEKALSENASQNALEKYLPKIKETIVSLVNGLRTKQALYKQIYKPPTNNGSIGNGGDVETGHENNSLPPPISATVATYPKTHAADPMDTLIHTENLERRASKRFSAFMKKEPGKRNSSRINNQVDLRPPEPEPRAIEKSKEEMVITTTIPTGQTNQYINGSKDATIAVVDKIQNVDEKVVKRKQAQESNVDEKVVKQKQAQESNVDEKKEKKKGIKLFLQLGNKVKKIQYEGDVGIPTLRILFIEKFQYNPGMNDFPQIYIKDPNVGIMYELEDLNEVKNDSVLALNIEDFEQIKKNIDQNIGELTKEFREIKKSFSENSKLLRHDGIVANTPSSLHLSESHFTQLANKILENVSKQKDSADKKVTEELVLKIVNEIKDQYSEAQELRRDLGVMRQVYAEFQENSKKTLETLSIRTENFKKVALTKKGSSSRTFIEAGKAKVDSKTRALLASVDDLQNLIDNLKLDVIQRRSKPKDTTIQHVKNESMNVQKELSSLQEYLKSVTPMWRKSWEDELNLIVDEQKFLNHQEQLIEDLMNDINKLTEVFEQILKVANVPRAFFVEPQEEGFEGLKAVLQEVKGIVPDQERRLKALEQVEKQRERDLANHIDEFEAELGSLVTENKLKKTGGAEEIEKLRQKNKKNLMTLLSTEAPSSLSSPPPSPLS